MTVAQLAAFARFRAAHVAFVATYKTPQRPAALVESNAAGEEFIAQMVGAQVWVQADYVAAGLVLGTVSHAHERGDVSTEHGFNVWGHFCPASFSVDMAHLFFAEEAATLDFACSLD